MPSSPKKKASSSSSQMKGKESSNQSTKQRRLQSQQTDSHKSPVPPTISLSSPSLSAKMTSSAQWVKKKARNAVTPSSSAAEAAKSVGSEGNDEVEDVSEEDEESDEDGSSKEDGNDESESESGDDDGGVDEKGYNRLIKALGEDGLNEFDKANLEEMFGLGKDASGDSDDEEDDEEDEEETIGGDERIPLDDESSDEGSSSEQDDEDDDSDQMDVDEQPRDEEDIALDALENGVLEEDVVPRREIQIDNKVALDRIRSDIALDPTLPWTETLSVTYPKTIDADFNDDLARELAFYNQALHSVNEARTLASKSNPPLPWTRPADYFAEMIKTDSHMERIRQRLLDEKASIKKLEEMRKQRDGKKYGKQVQLEKLKEREKSKKDMEERLRGLKRKRKDMLSGDKEGNDQGGNEDDFDIAVEDAISERTGPRKKPKMPRAERDKRYGFGGGGPGAGRRAKQNTRESTDDFNPRDASGRGRLKASGGRGGLGGRRSGRGGRGTANRPGKSRRTAQRGGRS